MINGMIQNDLPIMANSGDKNAAPAAINLFGAVGNNANSQGWKPVENGDGYVVYRNPSDSSFHNVVIPNEQKYGHMAIIGKSGGNFDVVIRDSNGNIKQYVHQNIKAPEVESYFNGMVQQRMKHVKDEGYGYPESAKL
jgi:surface antigen